MAEAVPWVLWAWVFVNVALFAVRPGRDAALIAILAGWMILPVMPYPASVFRDAVGDGGSAHAVTLAGGTLANKATAIGLGCLCGMVLFDWPALRRLRWSRLDLPMAVWCVVPMASALVNGLGTAEGLIQVRHQLLTWCVPYLVGRAYLADSDGLCRFAQSLVLAGLVALPLIVAEFLVGPFLYGLVYGAHPYQVEGASRPILWRPLLFQEHGNQFGVLIVTVAVAAVWLWRVRRLWVHRPEWPEWLSPGWVTAGLLGLAVACQSHGAILLGASGLSPLLFFGLRPSANGRRRIWGLRLLAAVLVLGLLSGGVLAALMAGDPGVREKVRSTFAGLGKTSVTWRLARSEESLRRIAAKPWLGSADRDWMRGPARAPVNPVNIGYGLLTLGTYGVVGFSAWAGAMIVPAAAALRRLPSLSWFTPPGASVALAAVLLLMNLGDSLFNSTWLLPMTAAAGGLGGWAQRKAVETAGRDRHFRA